MTDTIPLRSPAETAAALALEMPDQLTSGDRLRFLARAALEGERWGHYRLNRALLVDTLREIPTLEVSNG